VVVTADTEGMAVMEEEGMAVTVDMAWEGMALAISEGQER
jgi:hypothetical protein